MSLTFCAARGNRGGTFAATAAAPAASSSTLVEGEQDVIDLGPAAWWDASYEDSVTHSGGAVSSWMSREGNDAELVQGTGSAQPALDEVNSDFNDLSTLRFTNSASTVISNTTVYVDSTSDVGTIFLVGKCDGTAPSVGRLVNWGLANKGNIGVNHASQAFFVYEPVSSGGGVNGGAEESLFMVGVHIDGSSSYWSVNEGTNTTFTASANLTSASGVTAVGRHGGNTPDWDCAEYIIFNTALDDSDFATVETYLKNKYDGF